MKIRLEDADAKQLRAFILTTWGIDTAPNATVKSLKNKLTALGHEADEFELSDEDAAIATKDLREAAWGPEDSLKALTAGGMSEEDAQALLSLAAKGAVAAKQAERVASGEKPYGVGKEDLYCTIRVNPGTGKEGGFPVFVRGKNGRKDVPRGIDWPVETQVVEALDHAERIEYDEVVIRPDLPRRYVPRIVKRYPFQVVDGPYDHDEYMRRVPVAEAMRREQLGSLPDTASSPETAHLSDLAMA